MPGLDGAAKPARTVCEFINTIARMNLRDIVSSGMEWQIVSLKDDRPLVQEIQRQLTLLGFRPGTSDGVWGTATQSAYQAFARANRFDATILTPPMARLLLQARLTPPPIPTPPPTPRPPQFPPSRTLTDSDYRTVAQLIGCETATVRAVVEVESAGSGFLADGRPKILFEAHWFSDLTKGKYDISNPDISSRWWNPNLYVGGTGEWTRLEKAMKLDRAAALQSASWGLGQVMGFNFRQAGYTDLELFVKEMAISEGKQLIAMFNFIKSQKLDRFLISRDWAGFARSYNGEGYRQNRYDEKLAIAYQRWSRTLSG